MSPKLISGMSLVGLATLAVIGMALRYDPRPDAVFVESSCPRSAPMLSGGSGDGLPPARATEADSVSAVLESERDELMWRWDAVDVRMIPRRGEVWTGPGDGDFEMVADDGHMIEIVVPDTTRCPGSPQRLGSTPLLFNVAAR